tara:strand:+ start:399 stop:587 length:189 start_codon:yes stop_codon:yes gene_type:complete
MMEIKEELKDNLIADVENTLEINLTTEQTKALKRNFEITIGAEQLTTPASTYTINNPPSTTN